MGMNKYRALLANDLRQLMSDPMLMASILGPVFLIAAARYGLPPLEVWTERIAGFSLSGHASFISIFLLGTIPLLIGSLAGLLMLDERDENMIAYFGATPLARGGYLRYRLFLPCLLTLMMCGLFIPLSGIAEPRLESGYAVVLLLLEAPLLALFLAAVASNKVEGLALSKVAALLLTGPVMAYYAPEPWTYLGVVIPTYWPAQCYLSGISDDGAVSLGWFAGGLGLHLLLLAGLLRLFLNRAEQ